MRPHLSWLTTLVAAFTIHASTSSVPHDELAKLSPIHIADYEAAFGITRDAQHLSNLHPQDQTYLNWGRYKENGDLLLANMTLSAPDGMLTLMLELFDNLTSAIDCQGDDGSLSLTFNSQEAYDYALQTWSYINAHDDGKFLLITNHAGCGPDENRQSYIVTSVTEDSANRTTYLAAQTVPLSNVAASYELNVGTIPNQQPSKRHWWNGDIDVDTHKHTNFDLGHPGEITHLWHDPYRLLLDCINCFVTGYADLLLVIKMHHWDVKVATLTTVLSKVNATMELNALLLKVKKVEQMSHTKTIFEAPIPELGFEIHEVLDIGTIFKYNLAFSTKLIASANITFGATAHFPRDPQMTIDFLENHDHADCVNCEYDVDPIGTIESISGDLQFAARTQPTLAFGLNIHHFGKADIELAFYLPQIDRTFKTGYQKGGYCPNNTASETGVREVTTFGMDVWFTIEGKLDKFFDPTAGWSLFKKHKTLDDICEPIKIEGLGGKSESS